MYFVQAYKILIYKLIIFAKCAIIYCRKVL